MTDTTQTTPSEEELYKNIERCIGICSNPAYKGSYAAPREAFRAILRETAAAHYEKGIRDSLEVVESLRETPDEVRAMSHTAGYHFGLNRVASKLHTLLT